MRRASRVRVLPFAEANREAYDAANDLLVSSCDVLLASWEGQRGVDKGTTASVVERARSRGVPVEVVRPEGAERE